MTTTYQNFPRTMIECDESRYDNKKIAQRKELHYLFIQNPDELAFRYLDTGKAELFIKRNTRPYIAHVAAAVFDEMLTAIEKGATFEEICYMLNLPK